MRSICFIALLLTACAGCGEAGTEAVAEQDELAAYVAENPSPTIEEMQMQESKAEKVDVNE